MSTKYKYIESIVNKRANIFFSHIRWQVVGDAEMLKQLIKANDVTALDFYEKFYTELCSKSQDPQQRDLLNHPGTIIGTDHIPEISTTDLTISQLHEDFKVQQSIQKKNGWATRKKDQKT